MKNNINKKEVKSTLFIVLLACMLITAVYKVKEDVLTVTFAMSRFETKAKELNTTVYKDYGGSDVYEDGIVEGIEGFYKVYEIDSSTLTSYKTTNDLWAILEDIAPVLEAPLYSKSGEILSVMQMRGIKIECVGVSMPVDVINTIVVGDLESKLKSVSGYTGEILRAKQLRFKDYGVDVLYIVCENGEYVLPMVGAAVSQKLNVVNFKHYPIEDFIDTLQVLK